MAELSRHPAWPELRKLCEERMEMHFRVLAREFATKDTQPDYAALQWHRGFFAGMKFLLDNPQIQASKLEKALAEERKEVSLSG